MKKIFISALALAVCACGLFERDSSNFWLNRIRSYSTYPVYYYAADDYDLSEKMTDSEDVITHTYRRNVEVSANVGQKMVYSSSYKVRKFTINKITAQQDGVVTNTADEIHIKKGQEFFPLGEVKLDGKYYMLIDADGRGGILLVDEYGHIMNNVNALYNGKLLLSRTYATVHPENLTIKPIASSRTDISNTKENFEIIYNGMGNGVFDLTYIDYTGSESGEAKRYTYAQDAKLIDVDGVKMEITGVYPDRIEYKILD